MDRIGIYRCDVSYGEGNGAEVDEGIEGPVSDNTTIWKSANYSHLDISACSWLIDSSRVSF